MRIRSLNQALEGIYTPVLDIRDRAKLKIKCPDNEKVEKLFLKLISGIYHSNLDYIKGDVLEHCGKDHFVKIKGMDFPIILDGLVPADIIGFFKKYLNKIQYRN